MAEIKDRRSAAPPIAAVKLRSKQLLLGANTGREQVQQQAYSITSSASDSKLSETLRPSALAVCRLITISNLTGCNTGISVLPECANC